MSHPETTSGIYLRNGLKRQILIWGVQFKNAFCFLFGWVMNTILGLRSEILNPFHSSNGLLCVDGLFASWTIQFYGHRVS